MGKMNELSLLLDEMIEAGNKMVETAEAIKEYFSAAPTEPERKKPVREKKPEPEPEPAPEPKPEAKPQRSKSDIRALLVGKSNEAEGKYKPQAFSWRRTAIRRCAATLLVPWIPTMGFMTSKR